MNAEGRFSLTVPASLIIRAAAGNIESCAGAKRAILRRQPGGQCRDFRWFEQAAQFHAVDDGLTVIFIQIVEQFGVGAAGGDGVHQDAGLRGVFGQRLGQADP